MKQNSVTLCECGRDDIAKLGFDLHGLARPPVNCANGDLFDLDRAVGPRLLTFAHGRTCTSQIVEETAASGERYRAPGFLGSDQDVGKRLFRRRSRQHHRQQLGVGARGGKCDIRGGGFDTQQSRELMNHSIGQAQTQPVECDTIADCGQQQVVPEHFA